MKRIIKPNLRKIYSRIQLPMKTMLPYMKCRDDRYLYGLYGNVFLEILYDDYERYISDPEAYSNYVVYGTVVLPDEMDRVKHLDIPWNYKG